MSGSTKEAHGSHLAGANSRLDVSELHGNVKSA